MESRSHPKEDRGRRAAAARGLCLVAACAATLLVAGLSAAQQPSGDSGFGDIKPLQQPTPLPTLAPLPPLDTPSSSPDTVPATGSASASTTPAPGEAPKPSAPAKGGLAISPQVVVVLGIGVLVVVATIIVVLVVVLKPPVVINVLSRGGAAGGYAADGPAPAEWIEGEMVRMGRPPEGTLKILPGRFVIEDGDRAIELRIFRTSGDARVETTIGRDVGPPYRHIQLKPLSVSAKHAKLVYENGFYSIINYSRTNPTSVNSEPLPEGASRRLVDEDRVEVGEVLMVYHES